MLRRFEVENYKGFRERLVFDLSQTRNYEFHDEYIKDGLVNKALVVGKNGCGKTNLGYAIFDIVAVLTDKYLDQRLMDEHSFLNGFCDKDHATFLYEFVFDGTVIRYEYRKVSPQLIIYERLESGGTVIFERDSRSETSDYSGLESIGAGTLRTDLGDGKLSVLRYIANNTVQEPTSPVARVMDFANHMLYFKWVEKGPSFIGIMRVGETLDSFIISNGLVRQFQEFVAEKAKIEYELDSISAGGPDTMIVKTHRRDLVFDLISSSGTQALKLFFYWMKHFNQVKFLFMDEFDAFYHYELAEAILKDVSADTRFQTVFTSHNTSLISNRILRPDCYFEMENGRMGPLSERTERELRMGNNLEKLYRGGEFDE